MQKRMKNYAKYVDDDDVYDGDDDDNDKNKNNNDNGPTSLTN